MSKNKQHSKQFKLDAVQYRKEHPGLTQAECAKKPGIGVSTLARWEAQFRDNFGDIPTRGSGNYSSDEQKEIARLKSGQRLTEAVYTEVSAKAEAAKAAHRQVSISGMLKFLGMSRSGYHSFLQRKVSASKQHKEAVKKQIQQIYDQSNQNYGAPKITRELRKSGIRIAECMAGSYMKEMGIKAQWIKPWTTTTRDPDFSNQIHNILDEHSNPERPNAVWCTDITYIWTHDGFVYLTSIMDLYTRKIIALTLSNFMEVSCVIDTINKAKARRCTCFPLIIHSDKGSQYISQAYCNATVGMQRSYPHIGYPYDNACIEAFHSLIKREWLNRFQIQDYAHAHRLVFEYIETFYNTVHIHSYCKYISPNDFEKLYEKVAS